jgi:hypothetical protein
MITLWLNGYLHSKKFELCISDWLEDKEIAVDIEEMIISL